MNLVKVGDTSKALCNKCKSLVIISYQLRNVPFSDGSGIVKNVMSGVCQQCDSVTTMPHQSTPAIKRQLTKQSKGLDGRVPAHMIDILNNASYILGGTTELVPYMLKYYIHVLSKNHISPKGIKRFLNTDLATGISQKRISLKGRYIASEAEQLKKLTDIKATTDLLKSVVLKINDDILIHKRKKPMNDLKHLFAANS